MADRRSADRLPVRLLKPKQAYVLSALAGGFAGHGLSLVGAAVLAAGSVVGELTFSDIVVLILGFVASFLIAVPAILMIGTIAAPIAWMAHRMFRHSGFNYHPVCVICGSLIAFVATNLFHGQNDGFAARAAVLDGVSVISSFAGGALAGELFWRQAVRPLIGRA
jgi:hypothetical protein